MSYFVTGGTGFLGRYLIGNLLKRKGTIHVLVRKDSLKKFDALAKKMGWDSKRVLPVTGDMTAPKCGLTAAQIRTLSAKKIQHFFHLAAIYDIMPVQKASARPTSTAPSTRWTWRRH